MPARVQGMQREPGSMRARSPHAFFIYLFYFFLPPAASVSPLDRDKVTDLDLEKNAQRIFPYLVLLLRKFYFFASGGQRLAAGVRQGHEP